MIHLAHIQVAAKQPRLPLYLLGRKTTFVSVDGPAFLVQHAEQAPQRVPFTRISRIVSAISVQWSASALQAVFKNGFTVIFISPSGEVLGHIFPAHHRLFSLDELIQELAAHQDGLLHYKNWLRSERMRLILSSPGKRTPEYREMVRRYVYVDEKISPEWPLADFCHSTIHSYVLQQIHQIGLKPLYYTTQEENILLANDLSDLLFLYFILRINPERHLINLKEEDALILVSDFLCKYHQNLTYHLRRLQQHIHEVLQCP